MKLIASLVFDFVKVNFVEANIPGSSEKRLTGNGEKLTYSQLMAATGSAWVVFSFPPFPVSRFSDDPGKQC